MILSHEIIHLRRFDHQINLICRIILSFMFFHPLFYVAFREFVFATEQICDGWTVKLTGMRENYANCLIELSRASIGRLPIGFGRKGSSITKRIRAIFNDDEAFKMISRKNMIFLTVLSFVIVSIFSSVRVVGFASVGQSTFNQSIHSLPSTTNQTQNPFNIEKYNAKEPGYLALANNPENLPANDSDSQMKSLYDTAEKAFSEKKYKEAIDIYTKVLEEAGKPGMKTTDIASDFINIVKYKIASCYAELGQQTGDFAMYKKSLEIIPEVYNSAKAEKMKVSLLFLWGQNYYKVKQYEDAETKFKELLKEYPDNELAGSTYYSLGILYNQQRQYDSAREAFRAVVDKFPNSEYAADSQYYIADCFLREGNYNQAYEEYQKVQSGDPMMIAQARYYSCLSLLRAGRNQEALTAYQKFTVDFPDNVFTIAAYFDIGAIYSRLKEYEKANENYEQAILHARDDITKGVIQFEIGNNYFSAESYQSAIKAYQKLIDQYPKSNDIQDARFLIAESLWGIKDYKNALNAYNEILKDNTMGGYADKATYRIGEYYNQMGNKETALEWYQKAVNNYPKSPIVKDAVLGEIQVLKDLKRYDEAEKIGKEFINKYKADPTYSMACAEVQMTLGNVKFDTENYITAADGYMQVLSDYPDSPKLDPFKCRSLLQAGIAYYKEAGKKNWDPELLSKSVSAFEKLLDQYDKNFDKVNRDFKSRSEYVDSAKTNLEMASSKLK